MAEDRAPAPGVCDLDDAGDVLHCRGDWTVDGLRIEAIPARSGPARSRVVDASGINRMDTAGALRLHLLLGELGDVGDAGEDRPLRGLDEAHRGLLDLVAERYPAATPASPPSRLRAFGASTRERLVRPLRFLDFVGRIAVAGATQLARPPTIRWRQIVAEIELAGLRALPILGLLAFLTGVVIAYQGGTALRAYGANTFLVDLLAITMLREMAPLITAIIVAGRTGSAYAAQIGTMRITEEVDALRMLGIGPYQMLVLPKFAALVCALPLLTVFADLAGLLGGMVVADSLFGIDYRSFAERIPTAIEPSSFWVGIIKAPVFALIVAAVSCHHGFAVRASTQAIGQAATQSVVQSIFLVIIADAGFSVVFNLLGL